MFFVTIIASLALAVCTALNPVFIQNTIDACSLADNIAVQKYFMLYVCMIVGIILFEMTRQLSLGKYKVNKTNSLKEQIIKRLIMMNMKDFQTEKAQNYLTILNQETDRLVEDFYVQRLDLTYSILALMTSIFSLFYINYTLAILILICTFLPILVSSLQGKKLQVRVNIYTKSLEKLNVLIGNFIQNYPTLKVNRAEEKYGKVLANKNDEVAQSKFQETRTKVFVNLLIATLAYGGEVLLIGISIFLIGKGKLTIGALIAALQLSEMLAIPTNSIAYQLNDMNGVRGIKTKILTLLQKNGEQDNKGIKCPDIKKIEFKNVSFRYKNNYILKDINISFESGKKYLIVGENGSGKSTLFKLMSKFESDYDGEILINGIDLQQIDSSYYDQIGIILQNTVLMSDSLLNNITLYEDYNLKDIKKAMLSLDMDNFLVTHDLKSEYQDTKDNISGGEKQKIALTRFLLQKKKVILMDEATSAIDAESSYQIEERLLREKDITIINIEHKVIKELITYYDSILEVKNSTIKEIQSEDLFKNNI